MDNRATPDKDEPDQEIEIRLPFTSAEYKRFNTLLGKVYRDGTTVGFVAKVSYSEPHPDKEIDLIVTLKTIKREAGQKVIGLDGEIV